MANRDLERRLAELTRQFVDGVLSAVRESSVTEVAAALGGGRVLAGARAAGRAGRRAIMPAAGGRVAVPALRGARAAVAKGARTRKIVRRDSAEIERIRTGILKALSRAPGPVGSAYLAREIGGVSTADLAFPMQKLRDAGLVHKEGERTQAVYTLTEKGRSVVGKGPGGGGRAAKKAGKKK